VQELADLVAVGAAVRTREPRDASECEHASDLRVGGGSAIAARAEPHERVEIELHRLRCQVALEQNPDERGRCESVAN
jgi:hypothetical protein